MNTHDSDATMAVFLDLENIALGTHDAYYPSFSIQTVLERLLLKGHVVVKKAYCDFDRYKTFKRDLHEAAFELIEIPHLRMPAKTPPTSAWWWTRSTFATRRDTWIWSLPFLMTSGAFVKARLLTFHPCTRADRP